jgi:glycosyltransferase involved in cell wall biosynthesis
MKLSAIVIAKNEQQRIKRCVSSLSFADEIIVIDNASTDQTGEIAKNLGATVIANNERDFAKLRNIGSDTARGEWMLYIDADEIVSDELAREITEVIRQSFRRPQRPGSGVKLYAIRRQNYYLGILWPHEEKILRLFHRSALTEWYGKLHESPRTEGVAGELHGAVVHDTHRTLEEMVAKTNEWSDVEARLRFHAGHPQMTYWRFLRVMVTAFYDSFIRQEGWRTGTVGWVESIYQSFSIFVTYAKLWELQKQEAESQQG